MTTEDSGINGKFFFITPFEVHGISQEKGRQNIRAEGRGGVVEHHLPGILELTAAVIICRNLHELGFFSSLSLERERPWSPTFIFGLTTFQAAEWDIFL